MQKSRSVGEPLLLMPPFSGRENQIEPFAIKGKNVNPDCDSSGQLRRVVRVRRSAEKRGTRESELVRKRNGLFFRAAILAGYSSWMDAK